MTKWTAKVAKIEEAIRRKDILNADFIVQTKEALDAKMGQSEEKRETLLAELKDKLKVNSIFIYRSIYFLPN